MNARPQKVLIIDDDERNIFALKAVLTTKKLNCVTASGGLQALDMLKQYRDISVALVDMMMPDIDGYELVKLIRRIPELNNIMLVAVTAQAMVGDKEKCLAAGADAYLSKPVDVDILLDILKGSLNHQL